MQFLGAMLCYHSLQMFLVGNVADMSPRVVVMPTMSAEYWRRHNVADAGTGFVAGSRVGLDIYLVFFSPLNNSEDVSVAPTIRTGHSN
jgi:hypothetical protein